MAAAAAAAASAAARQLKLTRNVKLLEYIPLVLWSVPKQGDTVLQFRTVPRVGKVEIKRYLRALYDIDAVSVHTLNYDGKLKRIYGSSRRFIKRPSWKKVGTYMAAFLNCV